MEFVTKELFGGHVTVELPKDWIDASTRQPVPDNQEAFLSPTGPLDARLIFEIAEYITPRTDDDDEDGGSGHHQSGESYDLAALKYYVDDLVNVTEDDWTSTNPPRRIDLKSPSMKPYPAYYFVAQLKSRSSVTRSNAYGDLPRASTSSEPATWLHLLFLRVPQHGAEFVVQMIVKDGARHSTVAEQVMLKIAETLDFNSFDALVG